MPCMNRFIPVMLLGLYRLVLSIADFKYDMNVLKGYYSRRRIEEMYSLCFIRKIKALCTRADLYTTNDAMERSNSTYNVAL